MSEGRIFPVWFDSTVLGENMDHFLLFTMLLFCTLCKRLDFLVDEVKIWTICVVSYVNSEWTQFLWLYWGICILSTWKFFFFGCTLEVGQRSTPLQLTLPAPSASPFATCLCHHPSVFIFDWHVPDIYPTLISQRRYSYAFFGEEE